MQQTRRVRLIQGETVPIPVSERGCGRAMLTREGTAEVADGSWLARMIRRGDLELVADELPRLSTARPAAPAKE